MAALASLKSTLQAQHAADLKQRLAEQKGELEKAAEVVRSELEMKMVRAKEQALAEQARVFHSELDTAGKTASSRESTMRKELMGKHEEQIQKLTEEAAAKEKEYQKTIQQYEFKMKEMEQSKQQALQSLEEEKEAIINSTK